MLRWLFKGELGGFHRHIFSNIKPLFRLLNCLQDKPYREVNYLYCWLSFGRSGALKRPNRASPCLVPAPASCPQTPIGRCSHSGKTCADSNSIWVVMEMSSVYGSTDTTQELGYNWKINVLCVICLLVKQSNASTASVRVDWNQAGECCVLILSVTDQSNVIWQSGT